MLRTRSWLLLALLVPQTASAIQLGWGSCGRVAFKAATRCTLVVQSDAAEGRLPATWWLLWAADSCELRPVALAPGGDCSPDVAEIARLDDPATAADSSARQLTAHFCSAAGVPATRAQYVLDLPVGCGGKLKVVALDPTDSDSTRVLESPEVTFNGGTASPYPATMLRAVAVHGSLRYELVAVGVGLGTADSLRLIAPDASWSLPLTIDARADHGLSAGAAAAASLPACQASLFAGGTAVASVTLPAEPTPATLHPALCQTVAREDLLPPPPGESFAVLPKDFTFAGGFVDPASDRFALHLFYTRHSLYPGAGTERNIGHMWSTDFQTWSAPDTAALAVRPGAFDRLHVWAPTIVQRGPIFYMFYTGVDLTPAGKEHQRIGVATSADLETWTAAAAPVLTSPQIAWAAKDPVPYGRSQQLRDPFVMEDPLHPGQWLMYFVAVDSLQSPKMAVGVARSVNLRDWVADAEPLRAVERSTPQGAVTVVESPHVLWRNGQWWMPYTVNNDQVYFETTSSPDPTDARPELWSAPVLLRGVVEGDPAVLRYWHATEYLRVPPIEYLAAWNDLETSVDIAPMLTPSPPGTAAGDSLRLGCAGVAGVEDPGVAAGVLRLGVARRGWSDPAVGLRLELPAPMRARLAVYDVAGRRRATLVDRELPAGVTEVSWEGRDDAGARVASGMYFVRLACASGSRQAKVVMLR
jgi:hypothetical protein